MSANDIVTQLKAQGYSYIRHAGRTPAQKLDADAASEMVCVCGAKGLMLSAWTKPGSYVALAACHSCGEGEQI